ncbi:MAG: hypothetical protein ACTSPT_07615 [Candidatus Heimdallarchaeota archaeon]
MAIEDFIDIIPNIGVVWNTVIFLSLIWLVIVLIIVIVWVVTANKKKKGVDVSALAALAESDPMSDNAAANANPEEVMAILSIERVAASTALSAVKDARKRKRISSKVQDSLTSRYQARIAKIDADTKRRSGAQDYQHLADSLAQSKDRLSGEVMPSTGTPPPPPSSTPGIPSAAPPIPRPPSSGPPRSGVPMPPSVPSSGAPSLGTPPSKPASPIPTPPRIPTVGPPTTKPSTIVPPSVAPPTISTPPLPPRAPTKAPTVAPPTTSNMAPPPVPQSTPTAPSTSTPPPPAEGDGQSISGLRMEMLRELARLKKFMSDESQG